MQSCGKLLKASILRQSRNLSEIDVHELRTNPSYGSIERDKPALFSL